MARFTSLLLTVLAALGLALSTAYSYILLPLHGHGVIMLPDGTSVYGAFGGSAYGGGALAAAAGDYCSGAGVAVASGNSSNTAAAAGGPVSGNAVGTNTR